MPDVPRVVLASASAARLATLRRAGLDPEVVVSGVDETDVDAGTPVEIALTLARWKARAVAPTVGGPALVIGCDSVLELDEKAFGKPVSAAAAVRRWRAMRGRCGTLHTGHHLVRVSAPGEDLPDAEASGLASTVVHFADVSDEEIEAYVATGEPLEVAGAFTVDGLGGAFVEGIEGDHHNVVGLSLPLLRRLAAGLGVRWTDLWTPGRGQEGP